MSKFVLFTACIATSALLCNFANANSISPYVEQQSREIKSLNPEDVQGYMAGKGMGLAKAAELNGYPGPSHVLAMAHELALTAEQKQFTESLFKNMEAKAISFGRPLVEEERKLNQLFAIKAITPESLAQSLNRIGELQEQVRQAHLEAHLAQTAILTPEQIAKYNALRGYTDVPATEHHNEHHH